MKRLLSLLLACALLLTSGIALAAKENAADKGARYTMDTKGTVVLQNDEDRNIAYNKDQLTDNPLIEGESPTTGLPLGEGWYYPVMVQISNPEDTVKYNGKNVTAAGIGNRAPWSGQYADLVYEGILYREGQTRITFLYSDSLYDGQPTSAGPVRSARIGHALLREEWQGGIVFMGGPRVPGNNIVETFQELGAIEKGGVFNLDTNKYNDYWHRVDGLKGPENVTIDPVAVRETVPEEYRNATPHPFLFVDFSPYTEGYEQAYSINLDWGHKRYISHFYYDESNNLYLRYSGDVPYMSFDCVEDRSEENAEQLSFSNVIIQRVPYEFVNNNKVMPKMLAVGQGNADIFIGGRYIPGYWVRESVESPTVFFDDQGNEIQLTRGKTFIAHFPPERLLTYGGSN
jgi:hypothetical protein